MTPRRWLVVLGTGATGAGMALLVAPLSRVVAVPSTLAFVGIGVTAVVAAALAVLGGLAREDPGVAAPGEPSRRVPGDDFDATLASVSAAGRRAPGGRRRAVRDRLETAAVAVLVEVRGCSPGAARRALAAGDWTDDPLAAAFFRSDEPPALSGTDHLRALGGGELPFQRRARRAVAALVAVADGADGADGDERRPVEPDVESEGGTAPADGGGAPPR